MAKTQLQIHPNPNVLFQILDGEAVLLHLETETYYSLDDIGANMWQLLGEHGAIEPVITQLLNEYEVDADTLRKDILELVDRLAQAELIQTN